VTDQPALPNSATRARINATFCIQGESFIQIGFALGLGIPGP
jgi:hypothetical protein